MPIDPVCGMEVDEETKFKAEHNGKIYYFCSAHCKTRFEANPEKFIKKGHMEHGHKMHSHGHGRKRHGCCHH